MKPKFILAGKLQRNTILPFNGKPVIDIPGGDLLYAAAGLLVWEKSTGLLARAGEDYPPEWLNQLSKYGVDTKGIKVIPQALDLRNFIAYNENHEPSLSNPVSHFAKRGLPLPRQLSNYKESLYSQESGSEINLSSPRPLEIPEEYKITRNFHLCAMEIPSTTRLVSTFRESGAAILTMEPSKAWMLPDMWPEIRQLVNGLTAFLPSEEELRTLFWSKETDLLDMSRTITSENCEIVVVKCGIKGQLVHDGRNNKSWSVPAYPVTVYDPTGAGAAFSGGFLAGMVQTGDPLQATLMGNISASLAVEGSGIFHILETQTGLAEARLSTLKDGIREL